MSDTIDSTFGKLSLAPHSPPHDAVAEEINEERANPSRLSRVSHTSSRLSHTSHTSYTPPSALDNKEGPRAKSQAARNSRASATAINSRPRTSLDTFFDGGGDSNDLAGNASEASARTVSSAQTFLNYNATHEKKPSVNGGAGVREEARKVEAMENEIFNLKLKITLLEKSSKLGVDSKELYSQLTQAHAARRQLESENSLLHRRIDALHKQRTKENEELREEITEQDLKLAEQEEMLSTFLEAQDEYSHLCDRVLMMFHNPHLEDYAKDIEGTDPQAAVDAKLNSIHAVVSNLINALEFAQDNYSQVEKLIEGYLVEKDQMTRQHQQHVQLLDELSELFEGASYHQVLENVIDLLANNDALESQLQEHVLHEQKLNDEIEHLGQKVQIDVHNELERVRDENAKLIDAVAKSSAKSYDITRQFFRRLTAFMGPEWGDENDKRLRHIMEESKRLGRSKLPMLVDLMMQCVDELCTAARGAELLPTENAELEDKVKYLEDLLTQELTRLGAEKVLLARYKDLEQRLKIETEKRKNEYIGYQRSLTNLSLQ